MDDDLRIKPYKPRKKRFGPSAILMLAFVLVAIILLSLEMNRRIPAPDKDVREIAGDQRIGIADSVYFNRPFYFTLKRVAPGWDMQLLSTDTTFAPVNPDLPVFGQIHWLLQMSDTSATDTLAKTRVGVLKWQDTPDNKDVAIGLLSEILGKYETKQKRANILVPVSMPAHHILMGNYWAAVLPESKTLHNNVWVMSVMPRRNLTYIVLNQTREPLYSKYQSIFQKVNHGFRTLSMLDKDADYRF